MSENISDQNGVFLPYDQYGRLCYALSHAKTTMYDETHTVYEIINILASGADPGSTQVISINGKNGEVTLTAEDIVAQIISKDSDSPTKWENVEVIQNNETSKSIFTKISTMFKNIRYMWKLIGTTDISKINDGTITGNIESINDSVSGIKRVMPFDTFKLYDIALDRDITVSAKNSGDEINIPIRTGDIAIGKNSLINSAGTIKPLISLYSLTPPDNTIILNYDIFVSNYTIYLKIKLKNENTENITISNGYIFGKIMILYYSI